LCCGTGDIAQAVKRMHPEVEVLGMDFSEQMLTLASRRKTTSGNPVQFFRGDAMALPFAEQHFDAVTIGYGLRNVPDLTECLCEIRRVLKPGGVLVSLDVGKVRVPVIAELSQFFFFRIVPRIGEWLMPGQEMFSYLPHSSIQYPNQETLKRHLLELGFRQVEVHDFCFGASTVHVAYEPG